MTNGRLGVWVSVVLALTGASGPLEGCDRAAPPAGARVGSGSLPATARRGRARGASEMPAAAVFRQDRALEYRVTIAEVDRRHIEEHGDDEVFVPASLVVRGQDIGEIDLGRVGIRHKGAYSLHHCWDAFGGVRSRAQACAKLSYKLDFGEYQREKRLFGLKKLNLHASPGDPTKLRELLGYGLFREFGVDAPRIAPARVVVNGAFEGLFLAVEEIDGRYAEVHFPEGGTGNLYKEIWPHPSFTDSYFAGGLKTHTQEPDVSDMRGFASAVTASTEATFDADMARWTDVDALLRYIAVDRALKNWDGIMSFYGPHAPHNFYWYRDDGPRRRFHLIPWDLECVLWPFDPYMAPEQWVTSEPVPDFNEIPASCDRRTVHLDTDTLLTPPGCDPLLRLLAATHWPRIVELGNELLAGAFTMAALEPKLVAYEAMLAPIVAEDRTLDAARWRVDAAEFRSTLRRDIADFRAFLAEGTHAEVLPDPPPEPSSAQRAAHVPAGGLRPGIVNNFEFLRAARTVAPADTRLQASNGTTCHVAWNTERPLAGSGDLRLDFEFVRQPAAWDEWIQLVVGTAGFAEQDLSKYRQISLTLRADRPRVVRVRLESPAYTDTFGGIWSEFGNEFTVGPEPTTIKLRLARVFYPEWARKAWTAGQGWTTSDAEARALVLRRFTGLVLSPSPVTDAGGEMPEPTETGFLQIDDIYYQ